MASRSKDDLNHILVKAYNSAESIWKQRYPNRPQPLITCTFRNKKEQDELYSIGRTVKGKKVTNARGGESPHNYNPSFAFDIAFVNIQRKLDWSISLFEDFAGIIKEVSNEVIWGGDFRSFKDRPHFELKNWRQR